MKKTDLKRTESKRIPELLIPAGGPMQLQAAVANGADAVYLSGSSFNARINADNFTDDSLKEAVRFAHEHGVRVHVTLNTLLREDEFSEAVSFAKRCGEYGADALIIQDRALAAELRKQMPGMPLHLSTQGTVYDAAGVEEAYRAGFQRVILSRELSMEEIRRICRACEAEIEIFVHGAICIAYSGQCHMSYVIGGRSGNRGTCAQPCRLPYTLCRDGMPRDVENGKHLLSPSDMCLADHLGEIAETGVTSLKIEGRMKSPEYVAVVTRIYRKYLDLAAEGRPQRLTEQDRKELLSVFNRGGMTDAYFCGESGSSLMSRDIPKHRGIPVGNVVSCDRKKGHIDAKLTDTLSVGDGIEVRDGRETCGNVVTYLNDRGTMLKSAEAGRRVTIGDIKGRVRIGAQIFKITDKELMKQAEESYRKIPPRLPVYMTLIAEEGMPARLEASSRLWRRDANMQTAPPVPSALSALPISQVSPAPPVSPVQPASSVSPVQPKVLPVSLKTAPADALEALHENEECCWISVQITSEEHLERAEKRLPDETAIRKQLSKTGGTPYYLEDLQLKISGAPMISASLLNSLRRDALSALTKKRLEAMAKTGIPVSDEKTHGKACGKTHKDERHLQSDIEAHTVTEARAATEAHAAAEVRSAAESHEAMETHETIETRAAAEARAAIEAHAADVQRISLYFYDTGENEEKALSLIERIGKLRRNRNIDSQKKSEADRPESAELKDKNGRTKTVFDIFLPYRMLLKKQDRFIEAVKMAESWEVSPHQQMADGSSERVNPGQICLIPYLPPITKGFDGETLRKDAEKIRQLYKRGVVSAVSLGHSSQLSLFTAEDAAIPLYADESFHLHNIHAVSELSERGFRRGVLSHELSDEDCAAVISSEKVKSGAFLGEITVYGRIPVMHTEHCVIGSFGANGGECTAQSKKYHCRKGSYVLRDRKNEAFPVITDCSVCRMEILSHKTMDKIALMEKIGRTCSGCTPAVRICIFDETEEQVLRILKKLY